MSLLCKWFGWWCAVAPAPAPKPIEVVKPIEAPSVPVEEIVLNSACSKLYWKDRGKAPIGYYLGIAKTYAQAKCDKDLTAKLTRPATSSLDALNRYAISPTLPNVFTFLLGLGIRESTGKHCEGKDMSANFNTASTCEAGAWQTSYNAVDLQAGLKDFVWSWKKKCFLEDYSQKVTCSANSWKYWGNSQEPGYKFQKMAKECPAFHAEFTALVMRANYKHYGPIIRREVQFQKSCLEMFEQIDAVTVCP